MGKYIKTEYEKLRIQTYVLNWPCVYLFMVIFQA